MDGQVTSEWLEDDLFDIETHSLFRPNEDYLASHVSEIKTPRKNDIFRTIVRFPLALSS